MKHHKGDYMKCKHYAERKGFDNPQDLLPICMSSGKCSDDIPAPGWRDVREELPPRGKLIIACHDYGDRYSYAIYNSWHESDEKYMQLNNIILWMELTPAPPEGVQR